MNTFIMFVSGVLIGFAAGAICGIAYACHRIRAGTKPTLSSVINRDGGKGEEG